MAWWCKFVCEHHVFPSSLMSLLLFPGRLHRGSFSHRPRCTSFRIAGCSWNALLTTTWSIPTPRLLREADEHKCSLKPKSSYSHEYRSSWQIISLYRFCQWFGRLWVMDIVVITCLQLSKISCSLRGYLVFLVAGARTAQNKKFPHRCFNPEQEHERSKK